MPKIERYRGSLLGLAAGDALGTMLEFRSPGIFKPIDDMVGGGPFRLAPGQWTDDTLMALCLVESLVGKEGVLLAVNLGDDADTTGAIYGQLAGDYYGYMGIPEGWCEELALRDLIALAERFYYLSRTRDSGEIP